MCSRSAKKLSQSDKNQNEILFSAGNVGADLCHLNCSSQFTALCSFYADRRTNIQITDRTTAAQQQT